MGGHESNNQRARDREREREKRTWGKEGVVAASERPIAAAGEVPVPTDTGDPLPSDRAASPDPRLCHAGRGRLATTRKGTTRA